MAKTLAEPTKISGYIVLSEIGKPLVLGTDNVLWYPSERRPATCFRTWKQANRAIKRSDTYSSKRGWHLWKCNHWRIKSLQNV